MNNPRIDCAVFRENIWAFTGAAIVCWLPAYTLLRRARLDIYWNKQWRGSLVLPPIVSSSLWFVRVLPYPLVFSLFIYAAAQPRAGATPFFSFFGLILFIAGSDFIVSWRINRKERRFAGRDEKTYGAYGRRGQGDHSWILFVGVLLLFFRGIGFLIIIGYVIWRAVQSRTTKTTAGKGSFKLEEDTPLYSEILRIARAVGKVPKSIFIRTRPKMTGLLKVPLIEASEGNQPSIGNPVFPIENFIYVNPAAFTAALARRWAKEVKPNCDYSRWGTMAPLLTLIVVGSAVLVTSLVISLFWGFLLGTHFADLAAGLSGLLLTVSIIGSLRWVGLLRSRYEALSDGLHLWSDSPNAGQELIQQYLNALAEYHGFTHAIADAELVAHQFCLNRSVRKLMHKYDIDLEVALNTIRRHLEDDPIFPTMRERLPATNPLPPSEIRTAE